MPQGLPSPAGRSIECRPDEGHPIPEADRGDASSSPSITSVIMLIPDWNGEQASTAADDIDRLLDVMIVLSSFVFSIVMVMLVYALWRWRARPGDESDGEPIHGNTRLEIAWTVIPTVIVLFARRLLLDRARRHRGEGRRRDADRRHRPAVRVDTSTTPSEGVTSRELHVPVDQQLELSPARARRAPLLLGAGVADQARRGPGRAVLPASTTRRCHAGQGRDLQPDLHRALRHRATRR